MACAAITNRWLARFEVVELRVLKSCARGASKSPLFEPGIGVIRYSE
jgi:hypothetical protein